MSIICVSQKMYYSFLILKLPRSFLITNQNIWVMSKVPVHTETLYTHTNVKHLYNPDFTDKECFEIKICFLENFAK